MLTAISISVVSFILGIVVRSLWPIAVVAKQETDEIMAGRRYAFTAFRLFLAIRHQPKLEGRHLAYWEEVAKSFGSMELLPDDNQQQTNPP